MTSSTDMPMVISNDFVDPPPSRDTIENSTSAAHKSSLSICDLPDELLVYIFRLIERSSPYMTWFQFGEVCRYWHALLRSTPMLWTKIDIAKPVSFVSLCFERSQQLPVEIFAKGAIQDVHHVIGVVAVNVDRIFSLCLVFAPSGDTAILSHLRFVMPRLERLFIDSEDFTASPVRFRPYPGQFPILRDLSLCRCLAPWSSFMLGSLVRLQLVASYDIFSYHVPTMDVFLDMMQACSTSLETLIISFAGPTDAFVLPNHSHAGALRKVTLPRLQYFYLQNRPVDTSQILNRLILPPTTRIELSYSLHPTVPESEWISAIVPRHITSLPAFSKARVLSVGTFNTGAVQVHTYIGDVELPPILSLVVHLHRVRTSLPTQALFQVANIFSASSVEELDITELREEDSDTWKSVLGHFPNVQFLDVEFLPGCTEGVQPLFNALRESSTESLTPTLCPSLKDLSIQGGAYSEETTEAMLSSLAVRASQGSRLECLSFCKPEVYHHGDEHRDQDEATPWMAEEVLQQIDLLMIRLTSMHLKSITRSRGGECLSFNGTTWITCSSRPITRTRITPSVSCANICSL
ncbi:hypothetical protein B0H21DRAFT_142530 [Amylocystis lapponica]|nr:hypothetical protein B0H21DRAFT_142530 [Amylocystis lapponica]